MWIGAFSVSGYFESKSKDLSDLHNGQIVMARRLSDSISETATLVVHAMQWLVHIKDGPRKVVLQAVGKA